MNTIITKTYQPTNSSHPIWRVNREVQTRIYEFDIVNPDTGEILNKSFLLWRHDSIEEQTNPLYHGCSYRFSGYNPMPVTDWFHGIPLYKMLDWCKSQGLILRGCIKRFINIEYVDRS